MIKSKPKERPILFSDAMVRAILDGRKTQTRRPVRPLDPDQWGFIDEYDDAPWPLHHDKYGDFHRRPCPYGEVGDRLWVRETWRVSTCGRNYPSRRTTISVEYRAGVSHHAFQRQREWVVDDAESDALVASACGKGRIDHWRPSIHMPRWASRITLEITDVRVERVQAISEEDARAEGFPSRSPFAGEWDAIYAAKGLGWDANPWVWAISFRRVEGEQ